MNPAALSPEHAALVEAVTALVDAIPGPPPFPGADLTGPAHAAAALRDEAGLLLRACREGDPVVMRQRVRAIEACRRFIADFGVDLDHPALAPLWRAVLDACRRAAP